MTTDAIVVALPAASSAELDLSQVGGHSSLLQVAGRPAIAHVMQHLRESGAMGRIVLVSDEATRAAAPEADVFIDAGEIGEDKAVIAAIEAVAQTDRCLVMMGDMAGATGESISDLLTYAPEADVVYPVVEKSDVDSVFPGKSPYYVSAKEGKFTGSTVVLFRPSAVADRPEVLVQVLKARRNPSSLLGLLGAGFALKMVIGRTSLKEFQSALSSSLRLDCRVFISHFPELFVSLEMPSDVRRIDQLLGGAGGS